MISPFRNDRPTPGQTPSRARVRAIAIAATETPNWDVLSVGTAALAAAAVVAVVAAMAAPLLAAL
jgi:hypothetical protein